MFISYFHRHPSSGYSIDKVSRTYISEIEKTEQVENFYMPCANAGPLSILRNMWFAYKHRNRRGINHITGSLAYLILVLPKKKTIATVHDIGWESEYQKMNFLRVFLIKCIHLYPLYFFSKIVCISEYTKHELLTIMPSLSHKVSVIPNAVGPEFVYVEKDFEQNRPVVLHIGHAASAERKNLYRTIEALQGLNIHLRIVGRLNDCIISHLQKYQIDYSNTSNLSDDELAIEYQKCDIVNLPSLYEGFGMPIIEAQATGRVVITSNISPMKDIVGNYAALINPYEVEAIRACYLRVINEPSFRKKIVYEGRKNATYFRAISIVNQYFDLYKTIK